MAKKKIAVKSEVKMKVSRVFVFAGMILAASMAISVFLTAIFIK